MKTLELHHPMIKFLIRYRLFNENVCAQAEMNLIFDVIGYLNGKDLAILISMPSLLKDNSTHLTKVCQTLGVK